MDNLNFMKGFLILGDIASKPNETLADKVAYKERIVFSTMRSMIPDWKTISDEVKMERLLKLEEVI